MDDFLNFVMSVRIIDFDFPSSDLFHGATLFLCCCLVLHSLRTLATTRLGIVAKVRPNILSTIINWFSVRTNDSIRHDFRNIAMPRQNPNPYHSHGLAACDRSAANAMLDSFITRAGWIPYSVSMSQRDISRDVAGNRFYHFAKDLGMPLRSDPITKQSCLKLVDVDYYVDMKELAEHGLPIVIYTAVPTIAAGPVADGIISIRDNVVTTIVNGGARYQHRLWDYNTDHVVFHYWWGSRVFKVEHTTTGDINRRLVGLFPCATVYGPFAWCLPGYQLRRAEFTCGELNIIRYMNDNRIWVSVSKQGDHHSVTMEELGFRAIVVRASKVKEPKISDIERVLKTNKVADSTNIAPLIIDWLPTIQDFFHLPILMSTGSCRPTEDTVHYQTLQGLTMEDGVPMVRVCGQAFADAGFAPYRSYNNDLSCLTHRVWRARNTVESWSPRRLEFQNEFAQFLIPPSIAGTGTPYSADQVCSLQNRPQQQAKYNLSKMWAGMYTFIVSSFQKAEVYGKFAAPRNISTTNADHRNRYGSFIYPFSQHVLKPTPWYAFGMTPTEIAFAVHDLALRCKKWLVPTDYSSWDGTHSKPLVQFELMLLKRYFSADYHPELSTLLMDQYNACAFTSHDVPYNTRWSRLSGSSDTSAFNTVDNALLAYIVFREMGYAPRQAYQRLGIYGGDDGLTPDIDPDMYTGIVKSLGHELKADCIQSGGVVPFLGRHYLDAWVSPNSVIDVARQVRKLHLSVAPRDVPDHVVLARKATGYIITDPATPFIGHWARYIVRRYGLDHERSPDNSWFSQYARDDQWPQYDPDEDIMWDHVAQELGTSSAELHDDCQRIDEARGEEPAVYYHLITPIKIDIIHDGTIKTPDEIDNRKEISVQDADLLHSTIANSGGHFSVVHANVAAANTNPAANIKPPPAVQPTMVFERSRGCDHVLQYQSGTSLSSRASGTRSKNGSRGRGSPSSSITVRDLFGQQPINTNRQGCRSPGSSNHGESSGSPGGASKHTRVISNTTLPSIVTPPGSPAQG